MTDDEIIAALTRRGEPSTFDRLVGLETTRQELGEAALVVDIEIEGAQTDRLLAAWELLAPHTAADKALLHDWRALLADLSVDERRQLEDLLDAENL